MVLCGTYKYPAKKDQSENANILIFLLMNYAAIYGGGWELTIYRL